MLRYLQIKKMLIDLVSMMEPGQKLPDRTSLCKTLDTTRTTLDKAIRELVAQDFLTSRKGSGTYVSGALDGRMDDIENWGVIVPNITESVYSRLVKGIGNVAQEYGSNVILCNSENDPQKQEQIVRRLLASGVAGFIVVPVITSDPVHNYQMYSSLTSSNVPFIFCNRTIEGISAPMVTSNDFYGGYIATKYLINKGYRNIAFLSRHRYRTSLDRVHGYMAALSENNIPINRRLIMIPAASGQKIDTYEAFKELLTEEDGVVDSVFCFNDDIAEKAIQAITDLGKKVSDDIGVIGYDNTEICNNHVPRLSSVAYKTEEIGEKAGSLLYELCHGKPQASQFEYYLFQPEIVERESCMGCKEQQSAKTASV